MSPELITSDDRDSLLGLACRRGVRSGASAAFDVQREADELTSGGAAFVTVMQAADFDRF
jgi:hypothetical protein